MRLIACTLRAPLRGHRLKIRSQASQGARASATVRRATAKKRAGDLLPVIQSIRAEGLRSLREIAGALSERSIPAARGGEWSAIQVKRVLRLAEV